MQGTSLGRGAGYDQMVLLGWGGMGVGQREKEVLIGTTSLTCQSYFNAVFGNLEEMCPTNQRPCD